MSRVKPQTTKKMNTKNKISAVALGFCALLAISFNVVAAQTVITNQTLFETTLDDNAVWNGKLQMAFSPVGEFGLVNGHNPLVSPINDLDNWGMYNNIDGNSTTMNFTMEGSAGQIVLTFGDIVVTNPQTPGDVPDIPTPEVSLTLNGVGSYTTLWLGLESKRSGNSFSIINASLNSVAINDITANNISFAGIYTPVGTSWTLTGQFQAIHVNGEPYVYSGDDAGFYVFGDNTLGAVPEPSSALLITISGFMLILRRKR